MKGRVSKCFCQSWGWFSIPWIWAPFRFWTSPWWSPCPPRPPPPPPPPQSSAHRCARGCRGRLASRKHKTKLLMELGYSTSLLLAGYDVGKCGKACWLDLPFPVPALDLLHLDSHPPPDPPPALAPPPPPPRRRRPLPLMLGHRHL